MREENKRSPTESLEQQNSPNDSPEDVEPTVADTIAENSETEISEPTEEESFAEEEPFVQPKRRRYILIVVGMVVVLLITLLVLSLKNCKPQKTIPITEPEESAPKQKPDADEPKEIGSWTVISLINPIPETAKFDIYILSGECSWKFASINIALSPNETRKDIKSHLADLINRMKQATDIICVGSASVEGRLAEEENRATARAEQLIVWLREVLPYRIPLWTLDFGQFKGTFDKWESPSHSQTAHQRKVILIGVYEKAEGINLREALRNVLEQEGALPYNLDDFSKFELRKKT